ncbi:hypothetical protein B0H19DRAFT_1083692 [Mycena capillaripes]|nr:hypothetical protein B0H19DRAFT_1083692 [Mycena capillaripes]
MSGSCVTYYHEEIKELLRLLQHLPDTIPIGNTHNFEGFVPDEDRVHDTGCVKSVVSHAIGDSFGPRRTPVKRCTRTKSQSQNCKPQDALVFLFGGGRYLVDWELNLPENEEVQCRRLPKQRPDRRDEASSTPKPPGGLFLEPAGRVELVAGAAGYKAGRPSSYAVRGVRTSGKTLLGDLDSDPDLREVGLERRADGWPFKRGTYTAGGLSPGGPTNGDKTVSSAELSIFPPVSALFSSGRIKTPFWFQLKPSSAGCYRAKLGSGLGGGVTDSKDTRTNEGGGVLEEYFGHTCKGGASNDSQLQGREESVKVKVSVNVPGGHSSILRLLKMQAVDNVCTGVKEKALPEEAHAILSHRVVNHYSVKMYLHFVPVTRERAGSVASGICIFQFGAGLYAGCHNGGCVGFGHEPSADLMNYVLLENPGGSGSWILRVV